MMSRGWWTLGRFRGAPIRLHWTLPLGALLWSRFQFLPGFWLGFVALILIHELGHALIVVHYRLGLSEIALHGFGGYCRHQRGGTRFQEAAVAWGGVLAQLALFVTVQIVLFALGPPRSLQLGLLVYVFTQTNLWLAALNLLPFEPLDGAKAWPLAGMLLARFRNRTPHHRAPPAPQNETPAQKTDRIVRELIERTTQPKDR